MKTLKRSSWSLGLAAALALAGCHNHGDDGKTLLPDGKAATAKPAVGPDGTVTNQSDSRIAPDVLGIPEAPPPGAQGATLPGALTTLTQMGKISVEKSFKTESPAVTGFLVKQDGGQYGILYGLPGGFVVAGALIGPDGRNWTAEYAHDYVPVADASGVAGALAKDSSVFILGDNPKAPLLYAFVDANCGFCKAFFDDVKTLVDTGKVRVGVVMVAFLGDSSAGRAATILSSGNPGEAFILDETKFNSLAEQGGVESMKAPPPEVTEALQRHLDLMSSTGAHGTPTIVFPTEGPKWEARPGNPGRVWLATFSEQGHG